MRATDWSKTALGAVERWPAALRVTVSILLHARHPMFLWWGSELVQFYNDAYLPSFGVGKHPQAMGEKGEECWPEVWPIIGPQIRDVMDRGLSTWHEDQLVPIYRNGRLEDVYWTYGYSPVSAEDGRVAGVLVICQETTRDVRGRLETEAARLRLLGLFENAPAFVCTLRGPDHVFEMANLPYRRLVGAQRELVGRKLKDALPEVVEQGFVALLDGVYQNAKPLIGHETILHLDRQGDGLLEDVFVTFVYQPRRDAVGAVEGIDVFGFDVTAQVRARTEAEALAEAIPPQVWTAREDGALDFVNKRVLSYLGASRDEVLSAGWKAFIHPEDAVDHAEHWARSVQQGDELECEFRMRRSDGVFRWHLTRALPLRDSAGRIIKWFGTNTDIDEQKNSREELRRRNEVEQHLVGIVSHDLRNPLSVIVLGASALRASGTLDARAGRMVLSIQKAAQRSTRLIRDLLDFTRVRLGGGMPIHPEPLDVHELGAQVAEEIRVAHPGHEIVAESEGDGAGEWDSDRLAQLVANLLSNAVTYGEASTPVTLRTKGEGESIVIEVHNQGEPIPDALVANLFEPMKRGAADPSRSERSLGLGLYIVKEIATRLGGLVEVRSTRDQGTTFRVRLPRKPPVSVLSDLKAVAKGV